MSFLQKHAHIQRQKQVNAVFAHLKYKAPKPKDISDARWRGMIKFYIRNDGKI